MTLTPEQIATRYMASEVEYINRLLNIRDISKAKAVKMLDEAASLAIRSASDDIRRDDASTLSCPTIKYGVHQNCAWFNVL